MLLIRFIIAGVLRHFKTKRGKNNKNKGKMLYSRRSWDTEKRDARIDEKFFGFFPVLGLTKREIRAILTKRNTESRRNMPEWRNWQTPGT